MSLIWNILQSAIGLVAPEFINRRRVRFLVHTAVFDGESDVAFFSILQICREIGK